MHMLGKRLGELRSCPGGAVMRWSRHHRLLCAKATPERATASQLPEVDWSRYHLQVGMYRLCGIRHPLGLPSDSDAHHCIKGLPLHQVASSTAQWSVLSTWRTAARLSHLHNLRGAAVSMVKCSPYPCAP